MFLIISFRISSKRKSKINFQDETTLKIIYVWFKYCQVFLKTVFKQIFLVFWSEITSLKVNLLWADRNRDRLFILSTSHKKWPFFRVYVIFHTVIKLLAVKLAFTFTMFMLSSKLVIKSQMTSIGAGVASIWSAPRVNWFSH